jgi:hypothetical protein
MPSPFISYYISYVEAHLFPFFGKECLVQCKIPRVLQENGDPLQIPVPWEWSNTRSIEDYVYENGVLKALKVDFSF